MKVCSKCKQEKSDDQYYTYFHSVQQKHRTRHICQECMKKQAKEYKTKIKEEKQKPNPTLNQEKIVDQITPKLTTEVFKDNPDYKKCKVCEEYLEKDIHFYKNKKSGYYHSLCKTCHNDKHREATQRFHQERKENNGGSERVKPKPNHYMDVYQREQTFWLMELLGWTFDEESGVWWKEGIKDKNKNWNGIEKKEKIKRPGRKIVDYEKIIDLHKRGFSNEEISIKLNYVLPTVKKYLRLHL